MLQRADIAGARPLILIEALLPTTASGDARQEAFDRLNQLTLGKEFQAQVLSRLTNGSYLIKVDDALANVKLPPGTKTGDVIDLTLLATQPRPTFLLGKADGGSGASASLSNAGRLIGNLLQLAQKDGLPPTALTGKTPIAAGPDVPATQIAHALQSALSFSGLFYESHVAQWANGTRPFTDLQNEPAAKRTETLLTGTTTLPDGSDPKNETQTGSRMNDLGKLVANVRDWVNGGTTAEQRPALPAETLSVLKQATSSIDQSLRDSTGKMQEITGNEGVKLISLQLDTLEQKRILWQGELFPGQPMEWEISDETPKQNHGDETSSPEQSWQSTVRFSLPTLGTVSATVRLTGEHVQVNVRTVDEESATALRTYGSLLADALDAAGSKLDSLLVKHDRENAGQQTDDTAS
ncbi:MAG TPA: flagellar hook-length control protein FliK [Oxalicibacterium sp.]|uniref:flagellar hook-length control protein FliK n=1 Tax=Oxalicibacterium sp. TaxID=2766525 RepID=UPI002BA15916|nr:flagellar hook-length control protein FliK [Oxalicibacterium sp.]HWU98468.1 flagellar hook-length control protein FliK [Oxalicibacterium sp.]